MAQDVIDVDMQLEEEAVLSQLRLHDPASRSTAPSPDDVPGGMVSGELPLAAGAPSAQRGGLEAALLTEELQRLQGALRTVAQHFSLGQRPGRQRRQLRRQNRRQSSASTSQRSVSSR